MDLRTLASKIYPDFNAIPKRELLMFYGDNGSGKTKLAIEVASDITPLGKKILYVDTSAGYETINNHPDLYKAVASRMLVLPFEGEDQLNSLARAIAEKAGPFAEIGTVVLDESSSMAQQYLDVVVERRCRDDETKEKDLSTLPDFNIAGNKWRKTVQLFERIQGVSLIEIAHQRIDLRRKREFISPAFQPTVGNETRKEKRGIFYCDKREVEINGRKVNAFVVQTDKSDDVLAKTRIFCDGVPMPPVALPEIVRRGIEQDYNARIVHNEPNYDTEYNRSQEDNEPVEVD
jgi:hypothetical protein